MAKPTRFRRRPSTGNLKLDNQPSHLHTADPASPPESPTTSSSLTRKNSMKPRHQPDLMAFYRQSQMDNNIQPFGNGHGFSYQPRLGTEQLSPRSSSSDADADEDEDDADDDDDEEEEEDSSSLASAPMAPGLDASVEGDESEAETFDTSKNLDSYEDESSEAYSNEEGTTHFTETTSTFMCSFTIEEMDPMDSDYEGLEVIYPSSIEPSRSRPSSHHQGLEKDMMNTFKNLNCSNEASDEEGTLADSDAEEEAFLQRRQELRRLRRMSMGSSFGKRTHSEISDSEEDIEGLEVNEVGSSARRSRRKMHRTGLLFQDPPPERIEELEEPDSGDEAIAEHPLLRELPYFAMEVMEVDSS